MTVRAFFASRFLQLHCVALTLSVLTLAGCSKAPEPAVEAAKAPAAPAKPKATQTIAAKPAAPADPFAAPKSSESKQPTDDSRGYEKKQPAETEKFTPPTMFGELPKIPDPTKPTEIAKSKEPMKSEEPKLTTSEKPASSEKPTTSEKPAASPAAEVSPTALAQAPRGERPTTASRTATSLASAAGSTKDWPGFRGPTGMGTSDAKGLPLTWGLDDNLAWKVELPGPGASSPVVFGDKIYLTCYTGFFIPGQDGGSQDDLTRHLLVLNRADGSTVLDKAVKAKLPEEEKIRDHGFAANTPAVDAERIYVFFGKTGVFAFDHSGKEVWQADVGSKTHGWGTSSSPVLYNDMVFINASVESESLIALDRKTGKEKWRVGGIKESWNTPVVMTASSGRKELILAIQGKVMSFDPETGKELWTCKTDIGWYMVPSIVAHDGVVYCLGGRSGIAALAVRAGGDGDVTETHRLWKSVNGSNVCSPVYHDGYLYWTNEARETAFCAKADTGEIMYEKRLNRAGQIYSSALLAEGRLYYVSRDGKTFVLAAKPEFEELAVNELRDRSIFNGSPAVDGSRLLIRSDKFLYCVGK
jgi:outer membrane protein assembly factor BamB